MSSVAPSSLPHARRWPAWLLSCLLHGSILTVGALTLQVIPRGVEEPGRGTGIVLVAANAAGETNYFSEEQAAAGATGRETRNTAPEAAAPKIALPGVTELPQGVGPALPTTLPNAGLPGDDALIPGAGNLAQGGVKGQGLSPNAGETTVNVFGVQGTGSRFVFVFDRSGSMSGYGGRPLAAAKKELQAALRGLGQVHQFQIIFYNESPQVFQARPGIAPSLYFAEESMKQQAEKFVQGISADGGTMHLEALTRALAMQPDVIFFLTDADEPKLTEDELRRLREKNRRGTVINAVEFGAGPASGEFNFLQRLAKQHAGQHSYVDVSRLPSS